MKYLYFIPFVFIMGCSSSSQVSAIKRNLYSYRNGIYRVEYTGGRGPISWPALHPLGWVKDKAEVGGQGRKGRTGPHLWVRVSGIPSGDSMLLSVHIVSNDGQAEVHYVVNPRLGRLGIFSSGGTGAGGKGGGSGASWLWGGRNGGSGGEGGEGGDGGVIEVRYDSSALAYVNCGCIDYYNPGGSGGDGGSGGSGGNNGNGTMAGNDGIEGLAGVWGPPIVIRGPDGTVLRKIPVFVLHYGQNDDEAERRRKRIREYYRQSN